MARLARSTVVGYPHQVTQQGNYGQPVFEEDADFQRYLAWLSEFASRYTIDIWAYCLMRNHVHFVCVPKSEGGLAQAFNTLHMRYAQYFHSRKGVVGHLWKGRFLSCMLDDRSVLEEVRYIENDPVRGGLVERAEDYPWSSAQSHISGDCGPVLAKDCDLEKQIQNWRSYLVEEGDQAVLNKIRQNLKTGRPVGDTEFIHRLEGILGRRLEALPRGRPRKIALSQQRMVQ
jgi:putative transposase